MGNLMAYSGITAKLRAMQAKLLTEEDFVNISNLKAVPEVINYLKEKPAYEKYIARLDTDMYHRGAVERILNQSFYDDYTKIYRFVGVKQKEYLRSYWKRYEVNLINYCLRIVFNRYDIPFDIDYKKEVFDKYSQLSVGRLVTSKSIEELVDNLRDTEYYAPLAKLRESGQANLFDYDLALNLYYFTTFWKKEKALLKGKEQEVFLRDFGTSIDLLNLQWIYRAKKYYNMVPPDIYALTIPIHYRLRIPEFRALVDAPTAEEFSNRLKKTKYGDQLSFEPGNLPEKQCNRIMRAIFLADRRRNPYSMASVNTYLFLKEEEIDKLTTALECIRYGLSSRETLGYLGGVIQ